MMQGTEEIQSFVDTWLKKVNPILQKVSVGDFSQKLEVEEGDVFADLEKMLNTMIDDLKISVERNIELVQRLEAENVKLQKKVRELEQLNKITVDRELRMIELKAELKALESHDSSSSNPDEKPKPDAQSTNTAA